MTDPFAYVLWLFATGAVILAYVGRRRERISSTDNQKTPPETLPAK